jgi:hypothetical protein
VNGERERERGGGEEEEDGIEVNRKRISSRSCVPMLVSASKVAQALTPAPHYYREPFIVEQGTNKLRTFGI